MIDFRFHRPARNVQVNFSDGSFKITLKPASSRDAVAFYAAPRSEHIHQIDSNEHTVITRPDGTKLGLPFGIGSEFEDRLVVGMEAIPLWDLKVSTVPLNEFGTANPVTLDVTELLTCEPIGTLTEQLTQLRDNLADGAPLVGFTLADGEPAMLVYDHGTAPVDAARYTRQASKDGRFTWWMNQEPVTLRTVDQIGDLNTITKVEVTAKNTVLTYRNG